MVLMTLFIGPLTACQLYPSPNVVLRSVALPQSIPLDGDPIRVYTHRQRFTFRILVPDNTTFAVQQTKTQRKGLSPLQIKYLSVRDTVLNRDRIRAKAQVDYQLAMSTKQTKELLHQDQLSLDQIKKQLEPFIKAIEKQRADTKKYAEARAKWQIEENKKRFAEIDRQNKLARENPEVARQAALEKAAASDAAAKERLVAIQAKAVVTETKTIQQKAAANARLALTENQKQAEEFARQAQLQRINRIDIPFEEYIKEQEAILNPKKTKTADAQVQSLSEDPYTLAFLSDGRMQLQAGLGYELPARVELTLDGFSQPVSIPVLERMAGGQLVLSVEEDAQKRLAIYGGFSQADGTPDLSQPLLQLVWDSDNVQRFYWFEPDGTRISIPVNQLEQLQNEAQVPLTLPVEPMPILEWQNFRQAMPERLSFSPDPYALTNFALLP